MQASLLLAALDSGLGVLVGAHWAVVRRWEADSMGCLKALLVPTASLSGKTQKADLLSPDTSGRQKYSHLHLRQFVVHIS